ncbi:MAG: type II 3-dehydroquinate dehydratase [Bacteroidales bacterium]|nr:type II 3-dehydroquinate dehydratase [Bacteroidales bacterium]
MRILILNGPSLNLLGQRETDVYGKLSFEDYLDELIADFTEFEISYFQSNIEGEIIDKLQTANLEFNAIILNAGAYSHTSIAIADAIKAIDTPVIEVHISNIMAREDFRHVSYLAPNCTGSIIGFGLESYRLALLHFR